VFLFILFGCNLSAQDIIKLQNPSFEGTPHQGTYTSNLPHGWYDCGIIQFPTETAPDIHPKGFWENTLPASNGETYLGIVVRDNESWESVSQKLSQPLLPKNCYEISLEIAQSTDYWSGSRSHFDKKLKFNYTSPTVLRIWGGTNYCDTKELLAESEAVTHSEWKTYHFKLQPKFKYKYLVFEAFYKTPTLVAYNGHILIDNISDITTINCDTTIEPITDFLKEDTIPIIDVASAPKLHRKKKKPAHKRYRKTKKEPKKPNTYGDAKKKQAPSHGTFDDIDLNKLKEGHIIKLEKVYFEADTSTLNNSSFKILDELYHFLKENDKIIIEVGGHTNSTPPKKYCELLSTQRAEAVATYLIQKGIKIDRITFKGYGKSKPIASNRTKAGRKKNQRVEIKIIKIK